MNFMPLDSLIMLNPRGEKASKGHPRKITQGEARESSEKLIEEVPYFAGPLQERVVSALKLPEEIDFEPWRLKWPNPKGSAQSS